MSIEVKGGPAAPKDPTKKRKGFYVYLDAEIEASARSGQKAARELYMDEGRFIDRAKLTGGIEDEAILDLLKTGEGFKKVVHSIGVTVQPKSESIASCEFVLFMYGNKERFASGTQIHVPCSLSGDETIFALDDFEWTGDDKEVGQFQFVMENPGDTVIATVKLYVNDGFDVPEVTVDEPIDFESEPYQSMIADSIMNQGNNYRLKKAMEKAARGEDVTVAYIGGSITQGAGAVPIQEMCYARKSFLQIKELLGGGDNIHYVKAGVGGTPSELGMLRYDRDVLKDGEVEPDIVIVEFAVNDEGDETEGICFESLVLRILEAPYAPAVIMLFSVFSNDWNLQDRLRPIGECYNLPMVSVLDAVVPQFKKTKETGKVISKRQYFYDSYHPTNDGHQVMADCLAHLVSQAKKADADAADIDIAKGPAIGNRYKNVKLVDRSCYEGVLEVTEGGFTHTDEKLQWVEMDKNGKPTPEFPYNWMYQGDGESFRAKLTCKDLILILKDSESPEFGKAEVYVDGKKVLTADPHINDWTHCNPKIIHEGEENQTHEIEIRMVEGEEKKNFTILGFGYTLK